MAEHGQQYDEEDAPVSTTSNSSSYPPPPSFNPVSSNQPIVLPTNLSVDASHRISQSVVPDLMRVYENLTQSSTPQNLDDHNEEDGKGNDYAPDSMPEEQPSQNSFSREEGTSSSMYPQQQAGGWTYDALSIPIPPLPESVLAAMSAEGSSSVPAAPEPQDERTQDAAGGRKLRKRSLGSASSSRDDLSEQGSSTRSSKARRKAGKDNDGRWSKRFTWPDDLHRDFVSAIFDVGLTHSSPSTIMEHMPKHEQITSERIKSHLQKYRLHRSKSKKEFMTSYEETLSKMQNGGVRSFGSLSGGQVAGHLAYATINDLGTDSMENENGEEREEKRPASELNGEALVKKVSLAESQNALILPRLTEAEKKSPIGASMGYLMGLFFMLKQQLQAQRAGEAKNKPQPVTETFDSFVEGTHPTAFAYPVVPIPSHGPSNAVPPSSRSNIEESTMMKREMKSQMAFQNKMRALKQQEQKKYKSSFSAGDTGGHGKEISNPQSTDTEFKEASHQQQDGQVAGETAGDVEEHGRAHSSSVGGVDDLWNQDLMDDQLFEFLMNN